MRVADAGIVFVGWVVQVAVCAVALYETGVCHAGVVEHEAPLETHEVDGAGCVAGGEVGLEFEGAYEGGDGDVSFGGGGAVGSPAGD